MILTCPNCQARYVVDPNQIGAEGRRVRCAKCSHAWRQEPPADAPKSVQSAPEPAPIREEPSAAPPPRYTTPIEEVAPPTMRAGPPSLLGEAEKPRGVWGLVAAYAALIGCVAGVAYTLYSQRDQIVMAWPPAAALYEKAGIAVAPPMNGVGFAALSARRSSDGGVPALDLTGSVQNRSADWKSLAPVVADLIDAEGRIIASWRVGVGVTALRPHQQIAFRSSFSNPPESARGVRLSFRGK